MDYYVSSKEYFFVQFGEHTSWIYDSGRDCYIPSYFPYYKPIGNSISERSFREDIEKMRKDNLALRDKASSLAKDRHRGQKDKAGKDYFEAHVSKVAELVEQMFGGGSLVVIAYLHDLLEDTCTVEPELRELFPDEIVDAVVSLTRSSKESYPEYIQRVKHNPLAVKVKICDLMQNMDLTRIPNPTENDRRRVMKYACALTELTRPERKEDEK